jgi:hypothetical protein
MGDAESKIVQVSGKKYTQCKKAQVCFLGFFIENSYLSNILNNFRDNEVII